MSSIDNIKQQASEVFADCKQTIQTNWEKHKVKILVGAAIFGGGVLLIVTGGLAALPEAAAAALFFSGSFATIGGFAFTGYSALHSDNDNSETQSSTTTSVAADKEESATPVRQELDVEVSSFDPKGILVSKLMPSFVSPSQPVRASSPIATIEDVPEEDESVSKDLDAIALPLDTPSSSVTPSSPNAEDVSEKIGDEIVSKDPDAMAPNIASSSSEVNSNDGRSKAKETDLKNDDVPEEELLVREDEAQPKSTSASSMSSYIPSSQTTKKLIGYTLLAAAAIAATKHGIDCWNQLPEEEQQAYLSQLRNGAEYLGATVQQGLSKMASSLDIFSQEDTPTSLGFGTDATNRFSGSLNSSATLVQPEESFTRLNFGTNAPNNPLDLDVSKRGYFEYYGPRMMDVANDTFSSVSSFFGNMASSMYNSLPSGESVAQKFSINASSWGDSIDSWTQWASNADPVGSMINSTIGQNVQTCYSAASEYLTSEEGTPGKIQTLSDVLESCPYTASGPKLTLEEMGVPFVDLTNVEEPLTPTQQGVLQTLQELTTCSPHKQIAAEMPSLDYLLSISGNK